MSLCHCDTSASTPAEDCEERPERVAAGPPQSFGVLADCVPGGTFDVKQLDFGKAVFEARSIENDIRRIEDKIRHRAVGVASRSGALAADTAGDAPSTATGPRSLAAI